METKNRFGKQVSKTVATFAILIPGVINSGQIVNAQSLNGNAINAQRLSRKYEFNFAKQSPVENFTEYDLIKINENQKTILDSSPRNQVFEKNKKVIDELAKLKDGWDGQGSYSFDQDIILTSSELLNKLVVQPEIFPTLRQSIQMEYEKDNYYLEFEIFKDKIEYYFDFAGEEEDGFISKASEVDFERINKMVNDFVNRTVE